MGWGKNVRATMAMGAAVAASLLVSMSPASAEPAAGISTGSTNVNVSEAIGVPLCAQATSTVITLNNTGTFMAQTAVYQGASTATFTASTSYWFNPEGTFSDSLCSTPYVVPGTLTVSGGTSTNGVSCTGQAGYTRQAANGYVITTAGKTNTCKVDGVTALSSVLTFAGNQDPCLSDFPLPLPDPCGVAPEMAGVYAEV